MQTIKLEPRINTTHHKDFAVGSFSAALFLIGRNHALLAITASRSKGNALYHFKTEAAEDARLFEREKAHLSAETERAMSRR